MKDEKTLFKTLLLHPPHYHPVLLHPALPYLTAYLRSKGHEVKQKNLTPSAYKHLMPDIADVLDTFRDSYLYENSPPMLREMKSILEDHAAKVQHHDREFSIRRNTFNYLPKRDSTKLEELLLAIEEKEENLFHNFYQEQVLEEIATYQPSLVGLSISDHKQLVPSYILAAIIKEKHPSLPIVAGGHLITKKEDTFTSQDASKLYDHIDYLIFNEGEEPLEMLIDRLEEGKPVDDVPRLAYKQEGKVRVNDQGYPLIDVDELPTPVFDGFIEDQLTPEPYVPLSFYRGCWKGRTCKFCDLNETFSGFAAARKGLLPTVPKRARSIDNVFNDIQNLRAQGIKGYSFTDEWFVGKHLLELSKKIVEAGIDDIMFDWYGMLESLYAKKENAQLIYKAGGRFVQFGLESRSEAILKGMDKGYSHASAQDILKTTAQAGIMNHIFVLLGYPTGTIEEEMLNIPFLLDNKENYHTVKVTRFRLSGLSAPAVDEKEAAKIGLQRTYKEGDLAVNASYDGGNFTHHEIEALREITDEIIRRKHPYTPVMGEFAYHQRQYVGLKQLKEYSRWIMPRQDVGHHLIKLWNKLVTYDDNDPFVKMSRDIYMQHSTSKQKLAHFEKLKEYNPNPTDWKGNLKRYVRNHYPAGFSDIDDFIAVSYYAQRCYESHASGKR